MILIVFLGLMLSVIATLTVLAYSLYQTLFK